MSNVTIKATINGPYKVEGEVNVVDVQGRNHLQKNRCTLCRCGGSKNKPFCDGTHVKIGFKDPE